MVTIDARQSGADRRLVAGVRAESYDTPLGPVASESLQEKRGVVTRAVVHAEHLVRRADRIEDGAQSLNEEWQDLLFVEHGDDTRRVSVSRASG